MLLGATSLSLDSSKNYIKNLKKYIFVVLYNIFLPALFINRAKFRIDVNPLPETIFVI